MIKRYEKRPYVYISRAEAASRVVPPAVIYAGTGLGGSGITPPRNSDAAVIIMVLATILRTRTSPARINGARLLNTFVTCCTATNSVAKASANRAIRAAGRACARVCNAERDETSHVGAHRA